jgi:hypothetical protein
VSEADRPVDEAGEARLAYAGYSLFATGTIANWGNANFYGTGYFAGDISTAGAWLTVSASGASAYFGGDSGGDVQVGSNSWANEVHLWGPNVTWMRARAEGYDIGSSIRWKKDIVELPDALGSVRKMRGVNFRWKDVPEADKSKALQVGFIAEEMMKIVPEVVTPDPDAPGFASAIDYGKLTPVLAQAIKQLDGLALKLDVNGAAAVPGDLSAEDNAWGSGSGWISCPAEGECSCPNGSYVTKTKNRGEQVYCSKL